MEQQDYVVISMREPIVVRPECAQYEFEIKHGLHDEESTYFEVDLTAEEVGQLMGGS